MADAISGVAQQTIPNTNNTSGASEVRGSRQGLNVVANSVTTSALSDALDIAEEISMVRNQFKGLDKRKLGKNKSSYSEQLERIKKIQAVEQVQGISQFQSTLLAQPNVSKEKVLREAKEQFSDVFHQYIALHELAEAYAQQHGDEQTSGVHEAIQSLEAQYEQQIKIGLNLADEMPSVIESGLFESTSAVREEYFDHVQDHHTLEQAYRALNDKHGADNFEAAVDIQLKLLSSDLNCITPSSEKARLTAVMNDMQSLKVLAGVHDNCQTVSEQLARDPYGINMPSDQYMVGILSLINETWISSDRFYGLMRDLDVSELEPSIFFMNKTAETMKMMPDRIFPSSDTKQSMLSVIEEIQDALVLKESGEEVSDSNIGVMGEKELDDGILSDLLSSSVVSDSNKNNE